MTEQPGTPDPSRDPLERLVGELLRAQPPRAAPRTLEARVMAAIARRENVPWWRTSFLHWPLLARFAFVLASMVIVKLALSGLSWLAEGIRPTPLLGVAAKPFSWVRETSDSVARVADVCAAVAEAVPSSWLYTAAAVVALLYAALVVLGTTAYRTLYMSK
jgi:hypothetical protein